MRIQIALLLLVVVSVAGCGRLYDGPITLPLSPSVVDQVAPDNSAKNVRDADHTSKTPFDQKENQRDLNVTADIRKRLVGTDELSVNARNVKVITADGKVTLRGPVNSDAERLIIVKIATEVAGEGNVDNQLEEKSDESQQ